MNHMLPGKKESELDRRGVTSSRNPKAQRTSRGRGQVLSGISPNNPPPEVWFGEVPNPQVAGASGHTHKWIDFPHQYLPVFCRGHRVACGPLLTWGG